MLESTLKSWLDQISKCVVSKARTHSQKGGKQLQMIGKSVQHQWAHHGLSFGPFLESSIFSVLCETSLCPLLRNDGQPPGRLQAVRGEHFSNRVAKTGRVTIEDHGRHINNLETPPLHVVSDFLVFINFKGDCPLVWAARKVAWVSSVIAVGTCIQGCGYLLPTPNARPFISLDSH